MTREDEKVGPEDKWFNLGASRATGEDMEIFAGGRAAVAAKMTADQIAEAQRLAREWKPKTTTKQKQND